MAVRQAILPERLKEKTLADLKVGQSCYTVPWAMFADNNGNLWLHPRYVMHNERGGTVQMGVARTPYGYVVDVSHCDYKWQATNPVYAGGEFEAIPVIGLEE